MTLLPAIPSVTANVSRWFMCCGYTGSLSSFAPSFEGGRRAVSIPNQRKSAAEQAGNRPSLRAPGKQSEQCWLSSNRNYLTGPGSKEQHPGRCPATLGNQWIPAKTPRDAQVWLRPGGVMTRPEPICREQRPSPGQFSRPKLHNSLLPTSPLPASRSFWSPFIPKAKSCTNPEITLRAGRLSPAASDVARLRSSSQPIGLVIAWLQNGARVCAKGGLSGFRFIHPSAAAVGVPS